MLILGENEHKSSILRDRRIDKGNFTKSKLVEKHPYQKKFKVKLLMVIERETICY